MDSGPQSLEGYFRDPGFDQNIVGDLVMQSKREMGFDCNPGSGINKCLGTGCGIFLSRIREIITAKIYFLVANADFSGVSKQTKG